MYSGIVRTLGRVTKIDKSENLMSIVLRVDERFLEGLYLGASCAVNGVCLSVTSMKDNELSFDLIKETMNATTLSSLKISEDVHFERSLKVGEENGGHPLSGHIHTKAKVIALSKGDGVHNVTLSLDEKYAKYLFKKGFIGLHGTSLTVMETGKGSFTVSLIPETLRQTIFSRAEIGTEYNIEIDQMTMAVVTTTERFLASKSQK